MHPLPKYAACFQIDNLFFQEALVSINSLQYENQHAKPLKLVEIVGNPSQQTAEGLHYFLAQSVETGGSHSTNSFHETTPKCL